MNSWTETNTQSPRPLQASATRPSWQIARVVSAAILWRKRARLVLKQGRSSTPIRQRSCSKRRSSHVSEIVPKATPPKRTPRMPTEKEAALIEIAYKLSCAFCNEACVSDYMRCRVCVHTYHSQCLSQRGYLPNQPTSFRRFAKQDWTCPDCCDLTRLLSQDELLYLINAFDQIDVNKDGYIVLDEFLSLKANKAQRDGLELFVQHNPEIGKRHFSLMDWAETGVIAWSDFVLFYSCKLISAKDKVELSTKLTEKELVVARNLFLKDPRKTFDNDFNRIITREYFRQAHAECIQSLNKKYGVEFIDAILGYDNRLENTSEKASSVYWPEFLRELSLLILLNRSNVDVRSEEARRATVPLHLANVTKVSRPVLPSIERDSPARSTFSRSNTLVTSTSPVPFSYDSSFVKHGKLLEKIHRREKQLGSSVNYTIVENRAEPEKLHLPKLKLNARDDRRTITDPWTCVKEMQRLRNEPILLRTFKA